MKKFLILLLALVVSFFATAAARLKTSLSKGRSETSALRGRSERSNGLLRRPSSYRPSSRSPTSSRR